MSPLQLAIADAVKVALVLTMLGLACRRRLRLCWSIDAYLVVILACNWLITTYPAIYRTRSFYIQKTAVYDILQLCVAVEVAWYVFRAFPGARATARAVLLAIIAAVAVMIVRVPTVISYEYAVHSYRPQTLSATIWILSATATVATYYKLPLHAWHRAVLLGFATYLLVFVTLLNILRDYGWDLRARVSLIDAWCYLALITWWAVAAWRRAEPIVVPAAVVERLRMETV